MKLARQAILKLFHFFISLRDYYHSQKLFQAAPYRIEKINAETQQVVILYRGSRTYIKTSLEGAISAPHLVEGLPSMQACWLGYYYASSPINQKKSQRQLSQELKLQMKKGRFKVVSLEMRSSTLTYLDIKKNRVYKEKITQIMQDEFVINNFDPTQACYIGMQIGMKVAKYGVICVIFSL